MRGCPDRCSGQPTAHDAASASSRRSRPTSRCSTSASSRPRPTPRGPEHGCPPSRSGRRRAPGIPPRNGGAGGRGATPSGRRPWPTSAARRCVRLRSAPTRRVPRPTGWSSSSATSGSGHRRASNRGPGSRRCSTPTTASRSSVVTTRSCVAAPGRWAARPSGRRSATGTCRSAARSSPVCDWPGMCRHLAWLGEPRTVSSLVLEPELGLLRQSYQPRRQSHGLMNADGWGVGLYADDRPEPARWRSSRPLWSDTSFASVAPVLTSGCVLAAVGSATPGMPTDESASAPFTDGRWLLSHNGRVDRAVLPSYAEAESVCDSAVLAAHVFAQMTTPGVDHLAKIVTEVGRLDPSARLSLLLTDRTRVLATTWGDPLSYLVEPDGVVVASEPYDDDPRWVDVPDHHLLEATPDRVAVTALEER